MLHCIDPREMPRALQHLLEPQWLGRRRLRRSALRHPPHRWLAIHQPLRRPLRPSFCVTAQLAHDLGSLADVGFAETDAHGRSDREQPRVELAVARATFACEPHKLRALVFRIVDEFHEPLGRKLIRKPLHALATRGTHLGDLRYGKRTRKRKASHEAERTAAPAGDEPRLLTDGPYPEEALGHFEHQLGNRLSLALDDRTLLRPVSCHHHRLPFLLAGPFSSVDTVVVNSYDDTLVVMFGGVMDLTDRQADDTGTAGVIARPPLLFLAALLLGFVADHLLPLLSPIARIGLVHWISAITAGSLIVLGSALAAAGIRNLSRAGTPVPTNEPTRALVTTGIHGRTRNPIYLGFFLVYVGIGIVVRSPWILILTLPLAIAIRYGVVAREEAYLERRFGDAYRDYKARVRRWV
jgi:protein-S-isoprenylcysteine O-methyltransferase Ste14